ncbi:uncharacterized protein LOC134177210 isoform X2 [Corticium candelabrum]|uniref:uncharacterized protein LOC134177210 isoform X2 n=1 Tax=Corticium candelabrum TaxID=121492 RepID=UPI002E26470E|nr:uncharacterized protein LOC134177210 isoform X2 [Corticium candelabrum]
MSGLKFRDTTPADGNCLFHAVLDQLKRVKSEKPYCHSELRALAISCLRDHQFVDINGKKLNLSQYVSKDWDQYLSDMEKDGEWGDHLVVMALTTVLSHNILIVSSVDGASNHFTVTVEPNGHVASNDVPLLLGHYAENHFVSLDIAYNDDSAAQGLPYGDHNYARTDTVPPGTTRYGDHDYVRTDTDPPPGLQMNVTKIIATTCREDSRNIHSGIPGKSRKCDKDVVELHCATDIPPKMRRLQPFYILSSHEQKEVDQMMATALDKIASDRQLSDSNFPGVITVRDLAKLQPNKWLNDNVNCCKRASEMIHIGNVLVLTAHQCSIMFMGDGMLAAREESQELQYLLLCEARQSRSCCCKTMDNETADKYFPL